MRLAASIVFAAVALAAPARAHHSTAPFDMAQTVSVEGVVTRYEWANPHVYIWIEAPDETGASVEWQIEGQPPAVLRRQGWSDGTLAVGDAVSVTGNPARNAGLHSVFMISMTKADASLYDRSSFITALTTADAAPAGETASSLDGVWVTLLDLPAMRGMTDPGSQYPLTGAGAAAVAEFDETTMAPSLNCIPFPAPGFMIAPDVKRIAVEDGLIRIEGEFEAAERIVHMEDAIDSATPSVIEPSVQGYSVGRWEGSTLVIETTDFAPHLAGNAMSLFSGAQKHMIERLTVDEDGTGLAYSFELTDPDALTAPVTGSNRWVYRPDLEFAPVACDLENARRFAE